VMGPGGCFRHVELTSDERRTKGLTEAPSALELETVGLLEGSEAQAAAHDEDADALRHWLERQSDTLAQWIDNEPQDATAAAAPLRSPLRDIHRAQAVGSPTFEQPASPSVPDLMPAEEAPSSDIENIFSEMFATVAAMAARHGGCEDSGGPRPDRSERAGGHSVGQFGKGMETTQTNSADEELLDAPIQPRSSSFADPPYWQHVDPHPHLSIDLGLETISPEADWREFLAPEERPAEQRKRSVQPLPFADEPNYEDAESAGRTGSGDHDAAATSEERAVLVRSRVSAQLCMGCFDCPCACKGVELGGALRAASLCLACCDPSGCSCH
jgi:hypothetical protein